MIPRDNSEHVISSENVKKYIDETNDGGYWYVMNNGAEGREPEFVNMTDKALKIFGYESLEEVKAEGLTPHDLIHPIIENDRGEQQYWDFIDGRADRFEVECTYTTKSGEIKYGEVFVARSLVYPNSDEQPIYRAMMQVHEPSEAIFRQSRALFDEMSSGIGIIEELNGDYILRYANEGYRRIVKSTQEQIDAQMNKNIRPYMYGEDVEIMMSVYYEAFRTGRNIRRSYRVYDFEGNAIWIKAEHRRINVCNAKYLYIVFMSIDDIMNVQMEMKEANERLSSFINNTPAGICVFNQENGQYKIKAINDTLIDAIDEFHLIQRRNKVTREDLKEMSLENLMDFIYPMDRPMADEALKEAMESDKSECKFRLNLLSRRAEPVWIQNRLSVKTKEDGTLQLIAVFENITVQVLTELELQKKQAEIIKMSYHDPLTDVLNRQSYNEFIKRCGSNKFNNIGIAFMNLNGLKVINDTYGHSTGDDAVKKAVSMMLHYFDKDEIYRLGSDDFVIIRQNIPGDLFYGKMEQLQNELKSSELASLGYNWNQSVTALSREIDKAEKAMRVAKQDYYTRHLEDESRHRPSELNALLEDIQSGKYVMFLQPKAYTGDTRVVAAESLIRKLDNEGHVIPPNEFVPVMEKQHLVPHLDFFMLEETCKTLERWKREERPEIKISVNMSRVTLAEPDYIDRVLNITDKYDIDHSQIEFEITESTETMDRNKLEEISVELSKKGFGVSLDDMGTEYASVMMLTLKGLDTVKIDRGFVLQLNTNEGKILVRNIIKMCHELGELCIAEGVEDHETRKLLNSMGCDMYQGYLLAKPIPVRDFEKIIEGVEA